MFTQDTIVSVKVVARLLDLTPRRVQQLAADGIIPKAGHGKYELLEAIHAYIKHQRHLILKYRGRKWNDPDYEPEVIFDNEDFFPES